MILFLLPEWWLHSLAQGWWLLAIIRGCQDKRLRRSGEKTSARMRHLIVATFEMPVDVNTMVVGVAVERWHKGPTHFKVKLHCRRTASLCSHCTSAVMTATILSRVYWRSTSQLVSAIAMAHIIQCSMQESQIARVQQAGIWCTVLLRHLKGLAELSVVTGKPLHPRMFPYQKNLCELHSITPYCI